MSLWRRAPREVYHVYGEEEYLSGGAGTSIGAERIVSPLSDASLQGEQYAESSGQGIDAEPVGPFGPVPDPTPDRPFTPIDAGGNSLAGAPRISRPARIVGLSLLVAVLLATLVLIVITAMHRTSVKPHAATRLATGAVINSENSTLEGRASSNRNSAPKRASRALSTKYKAASPSSDEPRTHTNSHEPRIHSQAPRRLWIDRPAGSWSLAVYAAQPTKEEFGFER